MTRIEWSAPAEVTPAEPCDCFWHRRVFTHVRFGPPTDDLDWERYIAPLGRTMTRTDYEDGRTVWTMEMPMEGCLLTVGRLVHLGRVTFWATAGQPGGTPANGGAVRLVAGNNHSRRRPDGGDPTPIWNLPPQVGRAAFPAGSQLIVWPEAWWWHPVLADGRLVDPLATAESIGAVNDDDLPWSLSG